MNIVEYLQPAHDIMLELRVDLHESLPVLVSLVEVGEDLALLLLRLLVPNSSYRDVTLHNLRREDLG